MKPLNLFGSRFGRLHVTEVSESRKKGCKKTRWWLCRCDCGKDAWRSVDSLKSGRSNSCGCIRVETTRDRSLKHGHSVNRKRSREVASWARAKSRCHNPSDAKFRIYGARGIEMCKEWRESSSLFLSDMGPCPQGYTLDRIDVNGPYCKANCRWASRKQQGRNTRYNVHTEEGVLSEVAEKHGVNYKYLHRLHRMKGVPLQEAISRLKK